MRVWIDRNSDTIIKCKKEELPTKINPEYICHCDWIETEMTEERKKIHLGSQEPPDDYRIFNRRRSDGLFRPISEFFEREKGEVEK